MTWPFENDTRKAEQKLAVRSLDANKRRNLLIGIIIFAASLLLAFSMILLCNATIDTQIISRVNNTQEFAQLRTIGATYRQIKAVIHNERNRLSWKYILGGLFLGLLFNFVLPLKFYWGPSIACTVFSGIFVWLIVFLSFRAPAKLAASLSPIAALRLDNSKKYFFDNPKKSAYTLCSLILSGTLMFVVFSVISAVDVEELVRQPYCQSSSVYLKLNSTANEDSTYKLMKYSLFTEELKDKIEHIPGVAAIYPAKMLDCKISVSNHSGNTQYELSLNSIVGTSGFETQLVEGDMPNSPGCFSFSI